MAHSCQKDPQHIKSTDLERLQDCEVRVTDRGGREGSGQLQLTFS